MTTTTKQFALDGGTIAYLEESSAIPLVSIVVALRSGAASDPEAKSGLARLTMRMLRRGCVGLSSKEIEEAIDALGAEMAVDTSSSSVAIHAQVIGRNAEAFVDLVARLLATPAFPVDEFERLKRESVAEIVEARDNDRVVAQKAFQRTLFEGHAYGRNAGGTTASVASVTLDDVRAFWKQHFVRGNVVVGFAGDVREARAPELARRLVDKLPAGAAIADTVPPPPEPRGRRLVFVDKPERTQTQILIGGIGTWPHDADHVALTVGNAVFGGTFTSRLMKEIRSERGWSYGASSRISIDRQRQAISMWTFPGADDAAACVALEIELVEDFVKNGATADEIAFIKQFLVRSHAFDIDTAAKRMHHALDTDLLALPPDYHSAWPEHVAKVTQPDANAAVRARVHTDDLLFVVVGTASEIEADVRAAIPNLARHEIVPFDRE
jgi:zinc protease